MKKIINRIFNFCRVVARGPYQINNHKNEGSSSGSEPKDQQCSEHFDLNL
jgi:jasmonate ZIM domain-containing protein